MSLGLVFGATDGLLVLADGRQCKLSDEPERYVWQRDDTRKLGCAPGDRPLAVVATGRATFGGIPFIDLVLEFLQDRAAGNSESGAWTVRAVARDLRDQLEQLNTDGGNHSQRIVEGLVVGFSPETTEPEVWRFQSGAAEELDPDDAPEHEEPRKGHSVPFVSAQRVNEFDNIPFARTPRESAAGEAVLQDVDYSHALLEAGIEVDDPRFYATYKLGGLDLTTLRRAVLERLKMLIGADPNPFKDSQVGGEWMLVELRAGSAPLVHEVALGPFQADDPW